MVGPMAVKDVERVAQKRLVLLVKVWNAHTDVGFMPGLTLGAVYGAELVTAHHTWAPYIERRVATRPVSCGANIVYSLPVAPEAAVKTLHRQQPAKPRKPADLNLRVPLGDADLAPAQREDLSMTAAGASAGAPDSPLASTHMLREWDDEVFMQQARARKRHKVHCIARLKIEFGSETCLSTSTPIYQRAIKTMTMDDFVCGIILKDFAILDADPEISGHELRKHQGNLWYSVWDF